MGKKKISINFFSRLQSKKSTPPSLDSGILIVATLAFGCCRVEKKKEFWKDIKKSCFGINSNDANDIIESISEEKIIRETIETANDTDENDQRKDEDDLKKTKNNYCCINNEIIKKIINLASVHYKKEYPRGFDTITIFLKSDNNKYVVPRPNHNLGHAVRQAFLTRDLIYIILNKKYKDSDIAKFINCEMQKDKLFIEKLISASMYLRSGRVDEYGSKSNSYFKNNCDKNSARNFFNDLKTLGILETRDLDFEVAMTHIDSRDIRYKKHKYDKSRCGNISKIIYCAHCLDYLRMCRGDFGVKCRIKKYLKLDDTDINTLVKNAKKYLIETGVDIDKDFGSYTEDFYKLNHVNVDSVS